MAGLKLPKFIPTKAGMSGHPWLGEIEVERGAAGLDVLLHTAATEEGGTAGIRGDRRK